MSQRYARSPDRDTDVTASVSCAESPWSADVHHGCSGVARSHRRNSIDHLDGPSATIAGSRRAIASVVA
jgi:hypothetical protein